jgi:hypothetical protein
LVQGPLLGGPVSRFSVGTREFVKTPSPSPESSPDKEEATRVELDLAALDIHGELSKMVKETGAGDKAKHTAEATLDIPGDGLGMRASSCNMVAEAAAGKQRATRKKLMSQESVNFLLAKAKEPRPVLRVNHELLDSLKTLTPEMREKKRAIKIKAVENLQALRDWEADLVKRYETHGFIEIEVDEDEDSDDDKLWDFMM